MRLAFAVICTAALTAAPPAGAQPGRLLSAVPLKGAPADALAWRIRYETRDDGGRPTQSTGLVIAPRGGKGARPTVAWNHGTIGIVETCSPSRDPKVFDQIPGLRTMLAEGWALVATDYPGLGTKGPHGYLVGQAAAHAVLDGVRAAKSISGAGVGEQVALWGHSQGGHASLWAAARSATYASELRVRSIVAASPPTDLASVLDRLDPTAKGILTAYVLQSWSRTYGLPLTSVVESGTAGIIGRATRGCLGGKTGFDQLIRVIALKNRLDDLDLRRHPRWGPLLAGNSARPTSGIPLMLVSSNADKIVNDAVTRSFYAEAEAAGTPVTFVPLRMRDHATTAEDTAPNAIAFMARHFAVGR